MPHPTTSISLPDHVARLRARVARWRSRRYARCPLPAELWTAATEVARRRGAYQAAKLLGLSYESLRRRVERDVGVSQTGPREGPTFVELRGSDVMGASKEGPVLELVNVEGARLTVRLPVNAVLDVAGVVATFRRQP